MTMEGNQLARAMLSVHELEMSQAARYPGHTLSTASSVASCSASAEAGRCAGSAASW